MNGEIAFCIEPTTLGLGGSYSKHDIISENVQNRLSKIVYYGGDTTSKTDDDYAVTQYMIWEAMGATITQWCWNLGGRYQYLKANVQTKIDNHKLTPQSPNENYGGANVSINAKDLIIIPNENTPDNLEISLQKELENCVGSSIAYRSSTNDGQDVAVIKVKDPFRIK